MTVLQQWAYILYQDWQEERDGRVVPVPRPAIIRESEEKKVDTKTEDNIIVKDGGTQDISPQSFSWTEESVDTRIKFALRTADRRIDGVRQDGRVRMFGYFNDGDSTDEHGLEPGESEDHGGLVGEVRAILDSYRKSHPDYDLVNTREVNDITGSVRQGFYRVDIDVTLEERARQI